MNDRRLTWRDTMMDILCAPPLFVLLTGGIIWELLKRVLPRRDPWK